MFELDPAFPATSEALPGLPASLSNSSGIYLGPQFQFDLVRPGAALYGVNPTPEADNPMKPVVDLKARIVQIRNIERRNDFCWYNEKLRGTLADIFEQSKKSKVAFADLVNEKISILKGTAEPPPRKGDRHGKQL